MEGAEKVVRQPRAGEGHWALLGLTAEHYMNFPFVEAVEREFTADSARFVLGRYRVTGARQARVTSLLPAAVAFPSLCVARALRERERERERGKLMSVELLWP